MQVHELSHASGNGLFGIQHSVQNSEILVLELKQKRNSIHVPLQRQSTWDTVPKAYFAVLLIVWRVWHLCLGSRLSLVGVLWKFSSTRFNGTRFLRDMRKVLRELREALLLNLSGTGLSFSSRSARSWCFCQATVALTFWSTDAILFQFLVNFISKTIKTRAKLRQNKVQSSVKKEKWKLLHDIFGYTCLKQENQSWADFYLEAWKRTGLISTAV